MQDFSHKKVSEVDVVVFRRLIMITAAAGSLLAVMSYLGCLAQVFCLSPVRVVFGVLYTEVALLVYRQLVGRLVLGEKHGGRFLIAVFAKMVWVLGLLWMLWHSTREDQLATIVGVLSFIPGILGAIVSVGTRS